MDETITRLWIEIHYKKRFINSIRWFQGHSSSSKISEEMHWLIIFSFSFDRISNVWKNSWRLTLVKISKHKKWRWTVGIGAKSHLEVEEQRICRCSMFVFSHSLLFFSAGNLAFEVDQKQAFEVPLKNVSNSNKGKNEVTLQLHQAEDAKVSLMEIRFYVPSGDGDADAVEVNAKFSWRTKPNFRLDFRSFRNFIRTFYVALPF